MAIPNVEFEEIVNLISAIQETYSPFIGYKDLKDEAMIQELRRRFASHLNQLTEYIANV